MESHPSIILRKGKTEIKIENAAAIIKKINEMYPSKDSYSWLPNLNKIKREISDAERETQKKWIISAKDWFKKEMFGGLEDFEVVVNEQTSNTTSLEEKIEFVHPAQFADPYVYQPAASIPGITTSSSKEHMIQSVNKNAFEIRLDILKEAISWADRNDESTDEDVIGIAKKFYSFVENRR